MLDINRSLAPESREKNGFALGRQLTIEYHDCDPNALLAAEQVEAAMLLAARKSGATVISSNFHDFKPQGVSGVVVIAESHFTIHAWPEHDYAAVDIFTCADNIDLEVAVSSMKESFGSRETLISSDLNRGIIGPAGRLEKRFSESSGPEPAARDVRAVRTRPISWEKEVALENPWGVLTSVDVYDCDPALIRDADHIREFTAALCRRIDMKPYGPCQVVHFGQDEKVAGYSMTQLIETSLISGHFANATNTAYLDIFSCKFYEPRAVAEFAVSHFKGRHYKNQIALRR